MKNKRFEHFQRSPTNRYALNHWEITQVGYPPTLCCVWRQQMNLNEAIRFMVDVEDTATSWIELVSEEYEKN